MSHASEILETPLEIKVLLLEDDGIDAELVERYLSGLLPHRYHLQREKTLAEGMSALEANRYDIILLDLNLPDSHHLSTFEVLNEREKMRTPIVVLTGLGNEELGAQLVRQGALDFLVKGRFDAFLLGRVLRFARERFLLLHELTDAREREQQARERETRERELRLLAEMNEGRHTRALRPLYESAPHSFALVVTQYEELLEKALERRIYREAEKGFGRLLRQIAGELGQHRASPKDLVELHSRALHGRIQMQGSNEARNQVLIEEGRILLLELMGYIIEFYRAPWSLSERQSETYL